MIKRGGNKLFTSVEGIDVVEVNLFSEKTHCILYERLDDDNEDDFHNIDNYMDDEN
jgi:hypothetical protein